MIFLFFYKFNLILFLFKRYRKMQNQIQSDLKTAENIGL